MTLVLQDNEKIEKNIKINTIYGKGILYITSKSIVIVIDKKGLLFERLHTQIASIISSNKNKIKLTWPENNNLFDFTFRVSDAQYIVNDILIHHNYDDNFPDIMGASHVIYRPLAQLQRKPSVLINSNSLSMVSQQTLASIVF